MTEQRVGVIGLGAMGSRFARRLRAAGYEVGVFNRTVAKAEALAAELGARYWPTPRAAAEGSDVLVVSVWDSAALLAVAEGDDGLLAGLSSRHVIADTSTVEPEVSAELAVLAGQRGAALLDTPVSGSLDAADEGRLTMMIGGPAAALARVRPVLDVLASRILHVDEHNGAGLVIKLAINMQIAIQAVAWGEGLALAEQAGIDRAAATAAMLESVVASPMLRYRAPFVLHPPAEVWASAAQLRKDVAYAVERGAGPIRAGRHALTLLDELCRSERGEREAAELIVAAAEGLVPSGNGSADGWRRNDEEVVR
jgi:3-hydroxyisobutyrate dehydrogenase-like beta-hydroxyacid dehydrogenase